MSANPGPLVCHPELYTIIKAKMYIFYQQRFFTSFVSSISFSFQPAGIFLQRQSAATVETAYKWPYTSVMVISGLLILNTVASSQIFGLMKGKKLGGRSGIRSHCF